MMSIWSFVSWLSLALVSALAAFLLLYWNRPFPFLSPSNKNKYFISTDQRHLGLLEKWYLYQPEQRIVISAAKIKLTKGMVIEEGLIRKTLLKLALQRHPLLMSFVYSTSSSNPRFIRSSSENHSNNSNNSDNSWINLTFSKPSSLLEQNLKTNKNNITNNMDMNMHYLFQQTMENQLNTTFNITGSMNDPLWRVEILYLPKNENDQNKTSDEGSSYFYIVFAFSHLIADGLSGKIVLEDFVKILFNDNDSTNNIQLPAIPRPLDELLDLRPFTGEIVKAIIPNEVIQLFTAPKMTPPLYLGEQPTVPYPRLQTKLHFLHLPNKMVTRLREISRNRLVSFHSLLSSSVMCISYILANQSYSRTLDGKYKSRNHLQITCGSPTSIRNMLKDNYESTSTGQYIIPLESTHHLSASKYFYKDLCVKEYKFLHDLSNRSKGLRTWGLLNLVDIKSFLAQRLKKARTGRLATCEVSNLGHFQTHSNIQQLYFTQGNHYMGAVFCVSLVTLDHEDEGANLILSAPFPLIQKDEADSFLQGLEKLLLFLIEFEDQSNKTDRHVTSDDFQIASLMSLMPKLN